MAVAEASDDRTNRTDTSKPSGKTPGLSRSDHYAEAIRVSCQEGSRVSRTWRDRLLGAAAGSTLTLATLWLILVSAATTTVIQGV